MRLLRSSRAVIEEEEVPAAAAAPVIVNLPSLVLVFVFVLVVADKNCIREAFTISHTLGRAHKWCTLKSSIGIALPLLLLLIEVVVVVVVEVEEVDVPYCAKLEGDEAQYLLNSATWKPILTTGTEVKLALALALLFAAAAAAGGGGGGVGANRTLSFS